MPPIFPATEPLAARLAAEIDTRRTQKLKAMITNYPKRNNWAGDIPVCARQGVYSIRDWDKKTLHDVTLQARFEEGKRQENNLIMELMGLGYEIVEQQAPLTKDMTDKYNITGRIDGKIAFEDARIPFEVKSMKEYIFGKVNAVEDLKRDGFLSRYYRQCQLYMLGNNEEVMLLFLTDCLGHWKILVVRLNLDDAEAILKQVEVINSHIKANTLPERVPYDPDVCGWCNFAHICLPDILNDPKLKVENNPLVEQLLIERESLSPLKKKYDEVHEKLKEMFKDVPLAVVGEWTISGKPTKASTYTVNRAEGWKMTIESPGGKNGE
jgi:CRISPR/Cas system-associated exonuclease Cas4 (RecB family)